MTAMRRRFPYAPITNPAPLQPNELIERARQIITKAKTGNSTGIMLCLYPVVGEAEWSIEEPRHLTLAYCGTTDESDVTEKSLLAELEMIAASYAPMKIKTLGLAKLGTADEANVVLMETTKQLAEIRDAIEGYSRSQHKTFKPHVTIDNDGKDGGMASVDVPEYISFDRVALHYGTNVTVLELVGTANVRLVQRTAV